jgi:cytoskeletal protein RodZ
MHEVAGLPTDCGYTGSEFVRKRNAERRSWKSFEQKSIVLGRVLEASAAWVADAEARKAEANAKRAETAVVQDYAQHFSGAKPVTGQIDPPPEKDSHPTREAKAKAIGVNPSAIKRAEVIERKAPDLADKVVAGEMPASVAIKEIHRRDREQAGKE